MAIERKKKHLHLSAKGKLFSTQGKMLMGANVAAVFCNQCLGLVFVKQILGDDVLFSSVSSACMFILPLRYNKENIDPVAVAWIRLALPFPFIVEKIIWESTLTNFYWFSLIVNGKISYRTHHTNA